MAELVKDMVQDDPSNRPTIDQVVTRFETIRKALSTSKLRSRISPRDEIPLEGFFRAIPHTFRKIKYALQGHPAIPAR
jgi:hypothetical protein